MSVAWAGEGIVLSVRPYGEADALVTCLTDARGRHAGLVKGGTSKRKRALFQQGNLLTLEWKARLEEHLGTWTAEAKAAFSAAALSDPLALGGLTALCAMADSTLPEREAHPILYKQTLHLMETLGEPDWPAAYALWEMSLLRELGYGLDLTACAATGEMDDLIYVSPKSGRAVSAEAGAPYKAKMLPLPAFMIQEDARPNRADTQAALEVTGHFLDLWLLRPNRKEKPASRTRFIERLGE